MTRLKLIEGAISPGRGEAGEIGVSRAPNYPVIAFYLPQFHPIPENDEFWGSGFTEWANVTTAQPQFKGHYQPHLPADLGFYDLRTPEVREQQAELARKYGISGFCYHHYWFHGRRVLDRPFAEVLASGKPNFPFCLNWANENWTRRWDGGDNQVLIQQKYSDADSKAHIRSLYAAFVDQRYIRLNGKPLFLIYNIASIPDPRRVTDVMRETMVRDGMGEIHLCAAETFAGRIDPRPAGFDSAVEFPPHHAWRSGVETDYGFVNFLREFSGSLNDYRMVMHDALERAAPEFPLFRTVVPSWDNTARRKHRATMLLNSTPDLFGEWLYHMGVWTRRQFPRNDAPIFVNAWNEWAEGCHLEPDLAYGHNFLIATRRAIERAAQYQVSYVPGATQPREIYDDVLERDRFWLKYMSRRAVGWPAVQPDDGRPRYVLDEVCITRFLHHWLGNKRARLPFLRKLLAPIIKPLLRRLSSENIA